MLWLSANEVGSLIHIEADKILNKIPIILEILKAKAKQSKSDSKDKR